MPVAISVLSPIPFLPLEGSDGNIITEGFLMADNLNEYFSSVFIRGRYSILPVLETKFEGRE